MSGDKFDQLYNALKADGAVSGTREHFRKFVLAPGKQGYQNRKQLYDALYADGAVSSSSYEDFAQRLGLHAVKPQQKAKSVVQQSQKPATASQRAMQVPQQYQQVKPLQSQQPRQNNVATPSGTDYMKNWKLAHGRMDQMTPLEQAQANSIRSRMQNAQQQAYNQQKRNANPISESRITPKAKNFNETMQELSSPKAQRERAIQQRQDDARTLAKYEVEGNQFEKNDGKSGTIAPDIDSLVGPSMKEADELSWKQYQQEMINAGNDAYLRNTAWKNLQDNRIANRQKVLADNLSAKLQEIYSQKGLQEHIIESADKLNMSVEEYVDKYVTPHMMERAQSILGVKNIEELLPKSATEYVVRRLSDSILGTLSAGQDKSKDQRLREQQAMAISDGLEDMPTVDGYKAKEGYKSGVASRFVSTAANMAMDSPILGMTGGLSSYSVDLGKRVLISGLTKVGAIKAGAKLTAQQLGFKIANMTMAQKIGSGLIEGSAKGALNLGGYSSITAALGQASTGDDDSLAALGKAAAEGFEHGALTGSMFGASGAVMSPWVSKFGINGTEVSRGERWLHGAQKIGATAAGLGVEAGTMMVADNITGDKEISVGQWLEDVVMVGAFKAGEPSNYGKIGKALYGLTHNTNSTFAFGKDDNGNVRSVDIRLTKDEKNELINSASGKNLMDAFVKVDRASKTAPRDPKYKTAYTDFMNDTEVSQATKEKVNAALGLFNTTRGRSYRSVVDANNKQILEYTKDGTLLTRTSYKNADERRAILYKQKAYRDNDELLSLVGMARLKDRQHLDDNGKVKDIAILFLKDKGYDPTKKSSDPSNASLIAQLKNEKSALYADWVKYADRAGIVGEVSSDYSFFDNSLMGGVKDSFGIEDNRHNLFSILAKDPMKRTERENDAIRLMKLALESNLFPNGKPHEEQAVKQGESVAQDNNLGTELPNGEAVKAELNGLKQAEDEMDVLIRDNDVFGQNFQKLKQQGLTNPQIYDWMVQQGGLTVEQLEPFAHYINANARVQGMQEATKNAIDEQVSSYVQDWSFHGTLNGQEMNGEQAIFVQDRDGRMLILGSGEIAFDSTTGRAKEGVGDMIVCLDPATNEIVYLKSDDVTLSQTQDAENFGNEYRQKLQMINSHPYNQAAQEQAMLDAAKPQQEENNSNIKKDELRNNRIYVQGTGTSGTGNIAETEGTGKDTEGEQEVRSTRKFADGSDVPMTTDSKGRPTPDYEKMTPEQSAEILAEDFGENAEKVVDGQIQKAEKALKDAEKMKVDYTAEPNDIMEQEALKNQTIEAAKKQLDHAQNIKKAMTAKKVAETVGNTEKVDGAHEAGSVAAQKFVNAPRLVGNKRTRMLPDGETKIKGHYEIVPAESLTPSHDVNNGYKKSDGFPTDAEGRTVNDRDYEHDKAAQQNTDQIARKYNGMAIEQVPVVSDEGIVYDGNGRTMAGQKAAKEGTDGEYINDLLENAENFGFTREQIEQSGIEHPRLVLVTDERLPYDTATFSKFNRNEKKTQSNTEQAVAKAKTLTSDEVGAIVAEIEGNGSLDAFFNNSKAINDLIKTLVDKGIIGQNEVAQMMDSPERLSAQGREYVKNLLLGSIFKPETIRMLGIDSTVKNKAINAIRSVMDNMKLGDYSLRDEIDQAIQLLYEARQGGNKVDTLLRTPDMFGEDAAKRYSSISQMMALALEGKVSDFRDLLDEYNRIAAARNTGEGDVFGDAPTKEELVNEFLNFKKWQDYGTRHSENEGSNDVSGTEKPQQETSGGNESAGEGAEPERPRVEEPEDLVNKELESRIKVTDEETETPSENGPITRQKILIDGDKEVIKVDEPNDKGEYTGSYYDYDGKKFGDLNEVVEYIDGKAKEEPLPLLPNNEKPDPKFNPIEAAVNEFKKEHPLTEDEITNSDLDDLSKDMALDFLNGEVTDDLHRAIYESIYAKIHDNKVGIEPSEESASPASLKDRKEALLKRADSGEVKRKDEAWGMLADAEELVAEYYGVPYDEYGGRERTKSTTVSIVLGYVRRQLDKITDEPVPVASEKQVKFVNALAKGERLWAAGLEGMLPNKRQAGWLIDKMKALGDEYLLKMHPDEIEERDNEIRKGIDLVRKFNGAKPFDWEKEAAKIYSSDPMEGIKSAADGYEKEKASKTEPVKSEVKTADDAAVSASNKKVNDLWKELMNAGKDEASSSFIGLNSRQLEILPKLVSAMAENAYLRIKRGMHNLEDVVKEMRKEFAPAAKIFKKEDVDAIYEQMMNIRYRDGEQRMSLKEWADYYEKTSPKHQENLVGDSKTAEERKQAEKKFIGAVKLQLAFGRKFKSIVELRKFAERHGLKDIKDTDLQELAETAIVQRARSIAASEATDNAGKFKRILNLYENQPSLNQRDSERVMKQQYSTPAPYAFLADMYVKGNGKEIKSALEPSAGNGMLTIGLPKDAVHVNDIDAQRLANLRMQGFKNVTSQDGTQPFADKDVDVVVTNPPFGSATPKEYDGYKISSLEGQMAINALESMKDDGRAAIIIGGKTEYAKNGSLNPKDKAFLGYLYSHYNVEDVINVDGSLYAKQGTSYPTRIILINGRRLNENAFPPVKDKARAEAVKDYDELYKRIEDDILRSERMDSSIGGEGGSINTEPDKQGSADTHEEGVRTVKRVGSERPNSSGTGRLSDAASKSVPGNGLEGGRGTEPGREGGLSHGNTGTNGTGAEPTQSKESTTGTNDERIFGSGGTGRNDTQLSSDESANAGSGSGPRGQLQRVDKSVRGLSTEKVTYTPKSGNPFTLKAVMPADQQEAVNKNLEKLGDADQFLVDELGYNDKDDLYSHLAAEQVDSVALALQQAKKGNAFIIGDMTGIGKGRQAASLIRYAKKQGQVPVYFTKTAGLLSDVYRDLVDIGCPDLRPFVFGSAKEAAITDSDGNVVFALPSKSEVKRVLDYIEKNGKLPDEYDYVLTTYSQVSNGVYEFDENGARKEKKLAKGKTFGAAALSGQKRRDAIEKLMGNAYLILDESHTAGGNSGQGNYFQHIIQKAKNVTFFSATFAKRPDNMPIYALRTAMNEGGMKSSDLIDAVKRGGATLQEIMSQTLTQCGQMIRRERDMTGVTIDWKAIDDPERVQEQREQYDSIIGLFNDIINFQKKYVSSYVDERNDELAAIQSTIGIKKGTAALGIKNQPFASKAFNTVQQVLLSLKAKSAAERAIDYLKQGMKPVIALNNTNESQTGNLALGEEMDAPDLGTSLKKGLEGTLRYTKKDAKDNSESGYIKLSDLGDEAVEAYHELEKKIEQTSTGLSLSPIDVIKNELQKAGYKVGELTGRQTEFVYNENGTVTKIKRADTDKKKLARDFNDGKIDALILNKSAATGISLHASSKYKDQKKRVMIVAQQQLDVNDEVQMRGRIDRTGQVLRGAYEYVVSLIPAEQRLLMMFKAKLKSLDANTTSSQKSKFNEMEVADITNKYGDKVVKEYMAEHLDLYARMADPFGWEKSYGDDLSRIDPQSLVASGGGVGDGEAGADASKLLGRMALLRVSEQEKMLQEIGELYANEIQRLNEMGENDLEITELPLKAKTIHKEVWKQGAEPGGDNAFADNTYIEKVNMAILKKPMKASEVKASQEGLTGGKTWEEYKAEKKAAVREYFDQKIADETQKYEERAVKAATKAKEKYIKDGKKGQEKSGMTDEQIVKNAGFQYDTFYRQEKDKLNDVIKNLNAKAEMFERVLDTFDTNQTFVLPTDMNNPNELSGFGNSYGRLIDIKITDNYSPNASSVSFATLDGRRKITFPIAGKVGSGENKVDIIGSIDRMTKQAAGMGDNHIKVLNQNLNNWDRLTSNESRKDGYIVTGNLMQALVDSKDQGLGGQLVKYTTDTGEVKTGILMPDRFDPKGLTTDAPINSVADKFELSSWHGGIDEVTSSDGEVKVKRIDNNRGNFYELRVPKSKAKGGKYFLDNDLLKLVNGNNFETRGNNMLAEFKPEQLKPVLDRLSKMGVKVQEERKTSEEEGTHFREEDPQEIELPKDEYAVLAHTIDSSHKNYKRGKVNYEYTADNFYVFKYNKYNDYNVYQKIPIDGNEELINYIKNGINKETIRNPRDIDSALEAGWDGRNGHYWDSTSNQEGRGGSVRPGEVSSLRSRNGRPSDERMGEELSDSPSSAVNNHIERIAKKTGAKVSMVSSVDEITNKAAKAAIEEGRKITGWYDEKTGEVHLYMPNIHDRYTAEKTIWHEVVGHKGMRELFGEDRFDKFLRDVWYDLDKPENAALKKLVDEERKFNPLNIYDAIEEGIARLAEDGKGEAGFWNGIKNKVSDFLHEIGYRVAPNTKDVKYLLWLSKNLQKNPNDPYWKMRAEAVKYRLDHERMPAVVAHDGMFYGNDGKVRSMESLTKSEWDEATDGQIHFHTTPTAATALDRYHRSLDAHGYMATESYMDNMLSLKKLMNAIVPDKKIEDISSSENPYMLQNTMQGAMSDAAKLFEINIMKPLEKSMAGILDAFDGKNSDEKIRNFNLYMITKHGLERNREFFVRDFLKQMRMDEQKKQDADFLENSYYSDKEYLDNELKAGNIDLKEYYRQLDESIRNHFDADFEAGEHDYSGMHAIQEVAKSSDPYDDAEAIQSVMDSEAKMESIKKGAVKDYWGKVKAATQYSVDSDYKNGIISKELHGHVSNMFNWYVPLRKYDETTAEDTYGYITEKGDPKSFIGSTIMRARGHKYLSETNILAQIGAMGNRAISNGGQNAIKQAFARFARSHSGNNLITETSVWYETDPKTGIVYERYPDIPDDATPDEINQIVSDFNKDMKSKASQGLASKVYRRGSIGYKFQRAENRSQHIVDVMIAGKKHSFVINGNPRAAQALNGLLEHKVGTFGKPFSVISRYMAQTCTSYNPEFVMRNMIRDFEFASTNLLAKEGMAYTKTFEKYYAQVGLIEGIRNTKLSDFKKMTGFGLFSKYRNGTLDTSDKIQRYFKEFMENGGETGWVQVKNTKELTAEYKLHIKTERNKARKVSKGIFDAVFKNLENINEVAENLARFATYCASRDAGRSAVRSAYDAKEVSTNFNRHGSGSEIKSFKNGEMSGFDNAKKQTYRFTSAWFRNTSMFFNAGIQSTNLLIKNFKNNKAGTLGYIMAGPMISGMAMALLNNFLIANEDEKERNGVKDPYGELPDYIRRNNLCIYTGGGEFITIPLAIEERAFYGLGDLAAGLTFSKNISGQKNPALDAVGCISQLAPVTDYLGNASFGKNPGEETLKAVLPSATSPFLEWAFNSDWKGAPIHRENKFDEYQPSWMLAYQGTPEWLINMNKKVNAMTNDVAPGNENMLGNGFLDAVTDPAGLQHFYSGYLGGAATFMERLGGIVKNGKDTETKDISFVRSLFYTPSEKTSLQRTKSKWYNYLDETEKMIANAKRLKSKNVPLDELVKNYGDYYKFKQSKGAEKMNVIETATKEMKNWKKLRDKSNDTESIKFANQNIDNIMMRAVDELDKLN